MASPVGAYSELFSTTLRNIAKTAVDSTAAVNPTFDMFKAQAKSETGGAEMVLPVILGEETAPVFTDDSGSFTASESPDIVTAAKYEFDSFEVAQVRINRKTLELNKGRAQLLSILATHREASLQAFRKSIAANLHAEHNARASGAYLSLDSLCNDAVHDVGGIDYTTSGNSGWRPVTQDATDETDIKVILRTLFDGVKRNTGGTAKPNVAIVGQNAWDMVREYLDDHGTLTTIGGTSVEMEWESIRFEGVELRLDYDCPDDRVYALYTPALHLRWLNDNLLKVEEAQPVVKLDNGVIKNTLDVTHPVVSMLAVGTNQRRALGLVTGVGTVSGP